MEKADPLELFNACLGIIEQTPDDKEAERVLHVAISFLQMAEEEFARRSAPDFKSASTAHDWHARHVELIRRHALMAAVSRASPRPTREFGFHKMRGPP
jgi:hypothetical protein